MIFLQIGSNTNAAFILPQNIVRVEALSNYSKIYFAKGSPLVVTKVLNWFEESLSPDCFTRIHRSHLVNNDYVTSINTNCTNLRLANGETIAISRRRKREVKCFGQMVP